MVVHYLIYEMNNEKGVVLHSMYYRPLMKNRQKERRDPRIVYDPRFINNFLTCTHIFIGVLSENTTPDSSGKMSILLPSRL